jgi:hypothetical protein
LLQSIEPLVPVEAGEAGTFRVSAVRTKLRKIRRKQIY